MPNVLGGVNPIFRVANLQASIDYYVNALGFKADFRIGNWLACVCRDKLGLFLSVGDQGNPGAWIWVGVNDAESLYEEFQSKGAKIRQPPTNFQWAYEFQVEDLDGNVLRFGSDPLPDVPFGPWLDMHGQLCDARPDGGWGKRIGASA